jgi:hypothetical protein
MRLEVKLTFILSLIITIFTFMNLVIIKNQIVYLLNLVIFNLKKLDNNTHAVIDVRHNLYSPILQRFILLQVVILLLIFFVHKKTTSTFIYSILR